MKRWYFMLGSLGLLLAASTAAQATEEASWGQVKHSLSPSLAPVAVEEGALSPAAKLTFSRRMAGGLQPGRPNLVRITAELNGTWPHEEGVDPLGTCQPGFSAAPFPSGTGQLNLDGEEIEVSVAYNACLKDDFTSFNKGLAIFQDANGDELRVRFDGPILTFDPTTGVGELIAVVQALGGTGRYAGASGRWSGFGTTQANADGSFTDTLFYDGWISLPNFSR